jgi:alpha-tubulin suppressor-like RCC1 family protein
MPRRTLRACRPRAPLHPRSLALRAAGTILAATAAAAAAALPAAAAAPGPFPFPVPFPFAGSAIAGWGINDDGQLGTGQVSPPALRPVLAVLPPGTRITQVAPGCNHSLALTSTGTVLAWGSNLAGELGNGTIGGRNATPAPVQFPAGTGQIRSVSAGCGFSMAVTTDGKLLTWGGNQDGELGNGQLGTNASRAGLVTFPAGFTVRSAAAGFEHALAVGTNGQVEAWGDNSGGELGTGSTSKPVGQPVPVGLPPGTRITQATAGVHNSLAVTAGGGVLAWGANTSGDLGIGTLSGIVTVPRRTLVPPLLRVRSVFAGCNHTLALTVTGSVLAWGDNSSGQVGAGSTQDSFTIPVHVRLPQGTWAVALGGGCVHSEALTSRGQMFAWGAGTELGTGDGMMARVPERVLLPAGQVAVGTGSSSSGDHGLAVLRPAR